MATKSDRPGLLSKMAMFVRNPTKDWSDLDRPEPTAESGYDKQALKAMIERKRQNDFVRKREFDQLRKLRTRDASGVGGLARPSVFQTSMATDPDGRAVTLKKIDEIEAQMSKQWWKGKQESAAAEDPGFPVAQRPVLDDEDANAAEKPVAVVAGHFESTRSSDSLASDAEFTETEMGAGMAPIPGKRRPAGAPVDRYDGSAAGFSTSELFAIDVDEIATDPELEEAAIRFANGDDSGAESGLLQALRGDAIAPDVALSWAAALLDFYRATNNQAGFDSAVNEFAPRFDHGAPQWSGLSAGDSHRSAAPMGADNLRSNGVVASGAIWDSPAELSGEAMERLRDAMASQPMPWHLDWSRVTHIAADAMPLMAGLFGSLCDEPVSLRFSGGAKLVQALRAMMPSGDRSVESTWWSVRLNALRTMQLHDEFELAALDYCVTFEVSPPAWHPARCQFEAVNAAENASAADFSQAPTAPMGLDNRPATALELQGEVLGDATQALSGRSTAYQNGDHILVSCQGLVRVDFSAAGSILNWVAMRQSDGCSVQFRDVHRLVAAFFNVIGISEHARVVPRSI